jgi:hypothetical protein
MENQKRLEHFNQVCVWPATFVGEENQDRFVEFFKKELGTRVQFLEEVKTAPDIADRHPVEGTGGRNDVIFAVHNDDVAKFAVPRLTYGIRWIEDVFGNEDGPSVYPKRIKSYCN